MFDLNAQLKPNKYDSKYKRTLNISNLLQLLNFNDLEPCSYTDIHTLINKTTAFAETLISQCPYCNNDNYIKHGKYKNIQRYKCKDCKRTFSQKTNSSLKYLKHPAETLFKFIKLTIEKHTLSYCSKELKINIATAFFWRHKIFHFQENDTSVEKLQKNIIFLDLIATAISYKGSRNILSEKAKSTCHSPSLTGRDIFTSFLCDEQNSIHFKTLGTIYTWKDTFKEEVEKFINKNTYLKIKHCRLLNPIILYHNKKISYARKKEVQFNCTCNSIQDNIELNDNFNNFYCYFKRWMIDFNGVASKYINHYISFCGYDFINNKLSKITSSIYTFYKLITINHFISIKDLKELHFCY